MQSRYVSTALMSATMIVGIVGCGTSGNSTDQVKVAGLVKLDGTPVKSGTISFVPKDGKKPTSGGTILDGRFSVQVPKCLMKVTISSPKVVGKRKAYDTPDSPEIDIVEEAIPAVYNTDSTLERNVAVAESGMNFELKSAP